MGKGVETENMAVYVMKVRKKILDNKHSNTLSGIVIVGLAYSLNSQWNNAKKLFIQVIKIRKTKLEVNYLNTLTSIVNLVSTYKN